MSSVAEKPVAYRRRSDEAEDYGQSVTIVSPRKQRLSKIEASRASRTLDIELIRNHANKSNQRRSASEPVLYQYLSGDSGQSA